MTTTPTPVDAERVIESYAQALAAMTHRALLAESLVAQQSAQLEAAGGAA